MSLPDFLIYDEDYTLKNRAHCNYLMALGNIGLGEPEKAAAFPREAAGIEPTYMMGRIHQDSTPLSEKK